MTKQPRQQQQRQQARTLTHTHAQRHSAQMECGAFWNTHLHSGRTKERKKEEVAKNVKSNKIRCRHWRYTQAQHTQSRTQIHFARIPVCRVCVARFILNSMVRFTVRRSYGQTAFTLFAQLCSDLLCSNEENKVLYALRGVFVVVCAAGCVCCSAFAHNEHTITTHFHQCMAYTWVANLLPLDRLKYRASALRTQPIGSQSAITSIDLFLFRF